jgi:ATP-dependent Lon protease
MSDITINDQNGHESISVHQPDKDWLSIPNELPVLPLRNVVLFPYSVISISVGQARSLKLLKDVFSSNKLLTIVAYKDASTEEPKPDDLYVIGCIAQVIRMSPGENGNMNVLLQGLEKCSIEHWLKEQPYLQGQLNRLDDIEPEENDIEAEAVRINLLKSFTKLISILSYLPDKLVHSLAQTENYCQLTYLISSSMRLKIKEAQEILAQPDVLAKMLKLTDLVQHEMDVLELGQKIQTEAHGEMEKAQRDYVLRHQLKAIQRELGEENGQSIKVEEYRKKFQKAACQQKRQNRLSKNCLV